MQAFDCVCDKAVSRAEHIVTKMVEHMPKALLNRMHQNAADVAIIGKDQVTPLAKSNLSPDAILLRRWWCWLILRQLCRFIPYIAY